MSYARLSGQGSGHAPYGLAVVAASGAFLIAAASGLVSMRLATGPTSVWFPGALGIAVVLRWPAYRAALGVGLLIGIVAGLMIGGEPQLPAVLLAGAAGAEVAIGAGLVGWFRRRGASKGSPASNLLLSVALAGAVAPLIGSGLAAGVLTVQTGAPWPASFWTLWTASLAGAALLLPTATLATRAACADLFGPSTRWEFLGLLTASMLVAAVAAGWFPFPFVAILVPLTVAAVRLPPLGAAIVSAAALGFVLFGDRFGLVDLAGGALVRADQLQLSVVVAALIPVCLSLLLMESQHDKLAIVASQDRFRRLFEDAAIGMAVVTLDGRFATVNRALCQMLGHEPEDLVGRSLLEVTHADDVDIGRQTIRAALEGRIRTFKFEKRYRRQDGSTFWALLAGSVLQDPLTGAPQALLSQVEDIDTRRMAEIALRETEDRWHFALETARQGVWDTNIAENRTFHSPVWASILGYELAEISDRADAWLSYVHPEDLPGVLVSDREHLTGRSAWFEHEFRMRHKDGHWVWILDRGQVVSRDLDGHPLRMIGTHTDISVRKAAESELQEALDRYRLLAEHGADMIMRVRSDGRRLYVSPACRTLLGFEPDEMLAMDLADTLHPEDRERVRAHWQALRHGEAPRTCTYRMHRKDGTWRWVEDIARRIDDAETIVVVRDIEESVNARQRLEESEAGYRLLADHGADMIFKLDLDLTRTYVSPSCRHILGYAPEDLVGRTPVDMIHPDDAARIRQLYLDLLNGLDRATAVNRIRHQDGRWLWVEVSMRRLDHAETHEPVGILGSLRDVSERKAIEEELVRAKIQAEDAARAKADFLANMSHELRTPMTGIIAAADLLLGDQTRPLTASQRQIVDMQREAGRGLLAVVNDVLDFSKIEAGHLVVEKVGVNLRDVADAAVDTVRHQALSKAIRLEVRVDPSLPASVYGDSTRIRQILLNFLSNAIKFTANRGSVTLSVEPRGKNQIRFAVDDTGIGINPAELARLFERFTQADSSTARKFGGSGLGLAISKRLAELMGGEIEVWSKAGVGSTFAFSLPVEAERPATEAAPAPIPALSRSMRILLAEDNVMNQALIRMVLENAGCEVQAVSDGAEAVRAVLGTSGRTFDVVLMDVQMPGTDGYQATRLIRLGLNGRTLPIIALTANATTSEVERALSHAMDAHVAKPVDWSILFATIERVTRLSAPPSRIPEPGTVLSKGRTHQAIFDPQRFDELRSTIGTKRAAELLGLFQQELDQRLASVAASPCDWDQVAHQAHALASSAAAMGFSEVFSICRGVVEAANERSGDPTCLILVLRAAVGRAQAALADFDVAA